MAEDIEKAKEVALLKASKYIAGCLTVCLVFFCYNENKLKFGPIAINKSLNFCIMATCQLFSLYFIFNVQC